MPRSRATIAKLWTKLEDKECLQKLCAECTSVSGVMQAAGLISGSSSLKKLRALARKLRVKLPDPKVQAANRHTSSNWSAAQWRRALKKYDYNLCAVGRAIGCSGTHVQQYARRHVKDYKEQADRIQRPWVYAGDDEWRELGERHGWVAKQAATEPGWPAAPTILKHWRARGLVPDATTARAKQQAERETQQAGREAAKTTAQALENQRKENVRLQQQVDLLQRRTRARVCRWSGDVLTLGVLGDTHLGSLYENPDLVEAAYDEFEAAGVDDVLHAGDLLDGEKMREGHEYEIAVHGCDAQRDHVIKTYPRRKGIRTRFILGSHDLIFWKRAGINIGEAIAERRDDMEYLGMGQYDLEYHSIIIRVQHPIGGTSPYGISYRPQRIIEQLPGGQKPHILVLGHYHKAEVIPFYRNVYSVQVGTTQSQTAWMAGKALLAMMGFWILTININADGLGTITDQWFPHFEEEVRAERK